MASVREQLREVGDWQATLCERTGGPTWAAVIRALLHDLDRDDAVASLLADGEDPVTSMVWLRLLGAVHRLALDDPDGALAAHLPSAGGRHDPAGAAVATRTLLHAKTEAVRAEMVRRVQTNEVLRAAALSAAMNWIGEELDLLELGASAGLNLWLDRFRVVTATAAWGPKDARVVLEPEFDGEPPAGRVSIRSRRGCDHAPLDPFDPRDRRLLRSFVWPDQVERLSRLDAAIATSGETTVDRSDCRSWAREQLREPAPGRTVVYHSVVLPYLTREQEEELVAVIEAAGRRADATRRLAWVTLEPLDAHDLELAVRRWPEGDAHGLATVSAHGHRIDWRPHRLEGARAPTPKADGRP